MKEGNKKTNRADSPLRKENLHSLEHSPFSGKNEEAFRLLVNSIKDYAIFMIDANGNILTWNEGAQQIKGYTEEEIIGKNISVFYIPDDVKNKIPEYNLKMAIELGHYESEAQRLRKDGTAFWADVIFTPLYDAENKLKGFAKVTRDITEKKRIEEWIKSINKTLEQKVEERTKEITDYKYALDESSIIAITNQRGIIKHANDNFCKISKYSREELIGQDHRIINSGYHSKEFIRNLWVTIANGKIWHGELKNKAKDGSIYWVDTTIIPFLNEEGKPYQYLAIRSDITQRKAGEETIIQLNKNLEQKVLERTSQLQEVNKELEAFSYSVSHDLRAPLRAVNGYAKMLEEDYTAVLDNEGKRLINTIEENAKKMGCLIDDLLAFSRLGRKEVNKSAIDMTQLVKIVLAEISEATPYRAEIKTNPLDNIYADYALIKQVLINLISNAIKYSSKKENPVVHIKSEFKNKELIYSISDNGAGFDMQYANKLFGVFQRLHSAEEFSGTGVGLAIVQRIIFKHGGKVWAEGKPGEGATFYFSLPKEPLKP